MTAGVVDVLEQVGIQPSAQRVAVADYVLATEEHPSAEQVWARVKESFDPKRLFNPGRMG